MPSITIDGKVCEYDGKKMILQVALENDIEIPHYCYHPGLSIVASCRICLAEVAQPNPRNDNKLELVPKLLPTCQTPAVDGMEVFTNSPKSVANQKAVMEYLLINHPLDCPVCDQAGECYLQDYSYKYGRSESRFLEDKIKQPKKDIGPHVLLYSDRCIMCSRCVRFTREVTGTGEIGIFGRGNQEQIDVFPGKPLDNELSANVIDICPVGALLDKDFLFTQRVWYLKETSSIDGITASGDNISIHHNEGRVYRIKPRVNLEVNKWWTSDEIRYGWRFVHDEKRLTHPMRVNMGVQGQVEWQKANQMVVDQVRSTVEQHGEGSVWLMLSPMLSCEDAWLLGSFARAMDAKAKLVLGPVPVRGEDKSFPGGYTVYAEKCPNRRGVERVIEMLGGSDGEGGAVVGLDQFVADLGEKTCKANLLILTGNYPSDWTTKELAAGCRKRFTVVLDTLPSAISQSADVVLPTVTWMEKSGTFENAQGRLQVFEQAIPPCEFARPEGQVALNWMAAAGLEGSSLFDASKVRARMGGVFVGEVELPKKVSRADADMQFVEL